LHSAGILETNEKFEKSSTIQTGSLTQKVSQGILRTQKFTNQEKKGNKRKWPQKVQETKKTKG
jgi:hypothetical protein